MSADRAFWGDAHLCRCGVWIQRYVGRRAPSGAWMETTGMFRRHRCRLETSIAPVHTVAPDDHYRLAMCWCGADTWANKAERNRRNLDGTTHVCHTTAMPTSRTEQLPNPPKQVAKPVPPSQRMPTTPGAIKL